MNILIQLAVYYLWVNFIFIFTSVSMPKPKTDNCDEIQKAEIPRTFRKCHFRKLLIMNTPPMVSTILGVLSYLISIPNISDFLYSSFQGSVWFFMLAYGPFLTSHNCSTNDIYSLKNNGSFSLNKGYWFLYTVSFVIALALWLYVTIDAFIFFC